MEAASGSGGEADAQGGSGSGRRERTLAGRRGLVAEGAGDVGSRAQTLGAVGFI